MTKDNVENLYKYLGSRITKLRHIKGLTLENMAISVGVTYQQMHKYEKGENRISLDKLFKICESFQVPISYFVDDLLDESRMTVIDSNHHMAANNTRHFNKLPEPVKRRVMGLVKAINKGEGDANN